MAGPLIPTSTRAAGFGAPLHGPRRSRSHLLKGLRRLYRSTSSRLALNSKKRRGLVRVVVAVLVALLALFLLVSVRRSRRAARANHIVVTALGSSREELHFTQKKHAYLPRQRPLEDADLAPCSWVYLEANAYDGRDAHGFFTNANEVFEEALRAELAASRGFCAALFESDPALTDALLRVRADRGLYTKRFDVFPGVSVGNAFQKDTARSGGPRDVSLLGLISRMTLPLDKSGKGESSDMLVALANGHVGSVFVRISGSMAELFSHLDSLVSSPLLCERVDRLLLNVTTDVRDPSVAFHYSASAERFRSDLGVNGLKQIAHDLESQPNCRTRLFVQDEKGALAVPAPISEKSVLFSVLAGAPTFNERVYAQTDTWMRAVPTNRVVFFTNDLRKGRDLVAAQGRDVVFVQPRHPELEKHLSWMQSWSHLVRVRESWDRYIKNDPDIKWLALIDDDTFVFPAGFREYLSMFDHRSLVWGGSGELARIDNGDHGQYATWLRDLSRSHGGRHCYMVNETIPPRYRGVHEEIVESKTMNGRASSRTVSHMCQDRFCRRGCPAVPQGAAIFVSRRLVEAVYSSVESCEVSTASLCDRCGSQRLYMCVNWHVSGVKTLLTRGICRSPWKLEHRRNFPLALTYHGFGRHGHLTLSKGSIHGDMAQLWQLGEAYEDQGPWRCTVPMSEIANLIGCNGEGRYNYETKACEPLDEAAG